MRGVIRWRYTTVLLTLPLLANCGSSANATPTGLSVATIVAKTGRSESEALGELIRHNPQARLIRPEEVADAVAWLCGPGADSITGQAIAVAGGEIM